MRYVAAYLLAVLGSNTSPKAGDIEKILTSVGVECDASRVKQIINELNGKDIDQLMAEGLKKLASMPAAGAVAAAPAASSAGEAAPKEEKKEEKKVESESEDDDMGFGLFD